MEKYVHRRSDRHLPPASLIVFAALLCGFALVNLFWPKRENSELENRKLAQMPVFSVKTLLNGKWQDDFSTYLQDQVALRDGWINLESAVNALAFGKTEESGILNGKDGWMFTKLFTVSTDTEKQLGKNISAVTNFAQRYPGRVTFLLAPSASDIYPEMLPANAPMVDRCSRRGRPAYSGGSVPSSLQTGRPARAGRVPCTSSAPRTAARPSAPVCRAAA